MVPPQCTYGDYSYAWSCVWLRYNLEYWANTVGFPNKTIYNVSIVPGVVDTMDSWPNAIFYGDCGSCSAKDTEALQGVVDEKRKFAQKLKNVGMGLSILGAMTTLIILLWAKFKVAPEVCSSISTTMVEEEEGSITSITEDKNDNSANEY
jgi:hypothetical protein